jgi:hypothetical protein
MVLPGIGPAGRFADPALLFAGAGGLFGGALSVIGFLDLHLKVPAVQQGDDFVEFGIGFLELVDHLELPIGRIGHLRAGGGQKPSGPLTGEDQSLEDQDGGKQF